MREHQAKETDLIEVVPDDMPDSRPLQTDAAHVVVGDLDNLLQTEHTWVYNVRQFIHRHSAESTNKFNCVQTRKHFSNNQSTEKLLTLRLLSAGGPDITYLYQCTVSRPSG